MSNTNDVNNDINNNIYNNIYTKIGNTPVDIIDYGAGNLGSVAKAFRYLDIPCRIISSPDQVLSKASTGLVLPGVGAFGHAMERLRESEFLPVLQEYLSEDRPFLGICLGMQLLMQSSEEAPGIQGLGVVQGSCKRFTKGKIPQIGWNRITACKDSLLLKSISDDTYFYFVHSYYVSEPTPQWTTAVTDYYTSFPSVFENGSRCAVQFHPEKSGPAGLKLLQNWVRIIANQNGG